MQMVLLLPSIGQSSTYLIHLLRRHTCDRESEQELSHR